MDRIKTIKVKKGEKFSAKYIMCERAEKLTDEDSIAICDFVALVEFGYKNQIKHCRDAVKIEKNRKIVKNPEPKAWNRLRRACKKKGLPLTVVPGGYTPLCYNDQMVVQNFNMSGSSWYIVDKKEIGSLLHSEPKMSPKEAARAKYSLGLLPETILEEFLVDNNVYINSILVTNKEEVSISVGGCDCRHQLEPYWDSYVTDGNVCDTDERFPTVSCHDNDNHIGCIDGYIEERIQNFTYIIEWYQRCHPNGERYHSIHQVRIKRGYEKDTHTLNEIISIIKEKNLIYNN